MELVAGPTGADDRSDEELLAGARQNPEGFGVFYRRHEDVVLGYTRLWHGCSGSPGTSWAIRCGAGESMTARVGGWGCPSSSSPTWPSRPSSASPAARLSRQPSRVCPRRRRERSAPVSSKKAGGVERVPESTFELSKRLARGAVPKARPSIDHVDLPAAAERIEAQTPYPPGRCDRFDGSATPEDPEDMGSISAPADVQQIVEYRARCLCLRYWLDAHEADNRPARDDGLRILRDSRSWPTQRANGSGVRNRAVEAAERGQAATVASEVELNCDDGPDPARSPGRSRATAIASRWSATRSRSPDAKPPCQQHAAGAAGDEVDAIENRYGAGDRSGTARAYLLRAADPGTLDPLGLQPVAFYVAEIPSGAVPLTVTAKQDGAVIWRAEFPNASR